MCGFLVFWVSRFFGFGRFGLFLFLRLGSFDATSLDMVSLALFLRPRCGLGCGLGCGGESGHRHTRVKGADTEKAFQKEG